MYQIIQGTSDALKIYFNICKCHKNFFPSDQHEWFKKSEASDPEYADFYIWHEGKKNPKGGRNVEPNNWVSLFYGSAWTWSEKRQAYYLHQFAKQQPDLNYRNPKVMQQMSDVLRFWLSKGVSGFRVDAVRS